MAMNHQTLLQSKRKEESLPAFYSFTSWVEWRVPWRNR